MLLSWLRRRRRARLLAEPFPPAWLDHLRRNVPLYERLTPAEQRKLLDAVRVFVAEKDWEGCGGMAVTDEVKVTVAGHACLLLLGVRHDDFERVRTILVYPSAVAPPDGVVGPDGVVHEGVGVLGEAWHDGPVVLCWDEVLAGGRDPRDGRNVVLHEFAHQLDYLDGYADGVPRLPDRLRYAEWQEVTAAEYARLAADAGAGRPTLLDVYGATSPAEFFAVATEAFFERPVELRDRHPQLYGVLAGYYGQDPAARLAPGAEARPAPLLPPYRGSRADAPTPDREKRSLDWPGWVTIWELYPGVPRSFAMKYLDGQVTTLVACLIVLGLFTFLPAHKALAAWLVGGGLALFLAGAAVWLYAAIRWVDRRNGWAGQQDDKVTR